MRPTDGKLDAAEQISVIVKNVLKLKFNKAKFVLIIVSDPKPEMLDVFATSDMTEEQMIATLTETLRQHTSGEHFDLH